MTNIIKWILLAPIILFFVLLALANRHIVTVKFDPLGGVDNWLPSFDVPLFAVLFLGLMAGTIFGGVGTWFSQGKHRKNARKERQSAKKWQAEAEALNRERQEKQARATAALPYEANEDEMRSLN